MSRGLQGDVVYLCWPIAPLVYEPKCGGWEGCGVSANENSCAHHVTWSPNELRRSNSIANLWLWASGQEQQKKSWPAYSWEQCCAISSCPLWRHFPAIFYKFADFLLYFVYCISQSPQSLWVNHKLITSPFILLSCGGDFSSNFSGALSLKRYDNSDFFHNPVVK